MYYLWKRCNIFCWFMFAQYAKNWEEKLRNFKDTFSVNKAKDSFSVVKIYRACVQY